MLSFGYKGRAFKKDDLCTIAKAVEVMQYVVQELTEDYFDRFDSKDEKDTFGILWEFKRNRARVGILTDYLHEMEQELNKHDIAYWDR